MVVPIVDTWIAPERLVIVTTQAVLLACTAWALRAGSWHIAGIGWLAAGIALAAAQPLTPATFHVAAPATVLANSGGGRLRCADSKTAAAAHCRYSPGTRLGLAGVRLVPRPAADRAGLDLSLGTSQLAEPPRIS